MKFTALRILKLSSLIAYAVAPGAGTPTAAAAAVGVVKSMPDNADEIVVTARRSGLPIWTVNKSGSTVVLIGAIDGVAKETQWDPASLTQALVRADRVMFPDTVAVEASPFALIGYLTKWRKQARLPAGTSLSSLMGPDQFNRLLALVRLGLLKPDFDQKHPFHLALELRNIAKGKSGFGPDASDYTNKAVRKFKLNAVKVTASNAKPMASEFFASSPQSHIPCLLDAIKLVEAGPGAVRARSDAWAARRVAEFMRSPAQGVYQTCWPAGSVADITPTRGLNSMIRAMLEDRLTTVAVVSLESLALPGGVLDDLKGSGLEVTGPPWN